MQKGRSTTVASQAILECYQNFHDPKYLELDPLLIIRAYLGKREAEEIALIGALFAFGAVAQIQKSLHLAISRTAGIDLYHPQVDEKKAAVLLFDALKGFRHRIYVDRDLVILKLLYRRSVLKFGTLENHFLAHHQSTDETIEKGLAGLIADWRQWVEEIEFKPGAHFGHMLNSPVQKSACKRWVMFLNTATAKGNILIRKVLRIRLSEIIRNLSSNEWSSLDPRYCSKILEIWVINLSVYGLNMGSLFFKKVLSPHLIWIVI